MGEKEIYGLPVIESDLIEPDVLYAAALIYEADGSSRLSVTKISGLGALEADE